MRRHSALLLLVALAFGLGGCNTRTGSGVKWYNPATWLSGSSLRQVESVTVKLGDAEAKFLKEAQRASHETKLALARAPKSRPVDVATESNEVATAALDQLAGPLTIEESAALRKQVEGLLSEVETVRAQAESERTVRRLEISEASNTIHDLRQSLNDATAKMATDFARENAMANELRNQRFWKWAMIALAVVLGGLWLYARFALGGIPQGIGRGLAILRAKYPVAGEQATAVFDDILDQRQKREISKHA